MMKFIEHAKGFLEIGWNERDYEYIRKIVHKDYHPEWILMPENGADLVIREIKYLTSVIPDLKYEIMDFIVDKKERKVWLWSKMTGTQTKEFFGFPPTNKTFEHEGASIIYFDINDKIINRKAVYNFQDIFYQLEHIPAYWELSKIILKD